MLISIDYPSACAIVNVEIIVGGGIDSRFASRLYVNFIETNRLNLFQPVINARFLRRENFNLLISAFDKRFAYGPLT